MNKKKIQTFSNQDSITNSQSKIYNNINSYGKEYKNSSGEVTPYHILFNDHIDTILSLEKDDAIKYCIKKINKINEENKNNKDYKMVPNDEIQKIEEKLSNSTDSLDLIFNIKNIMKNKKEINKVSHRLKKRLI